MESPTKTQPLLQINSDSEDMNDVDQIRQLNDDGGSSSQINSYLENIESDTAEIETTDECDDTESLFKVANTVPNDRFSFTYVVFYLLGMTTLLPLV